MKIPTDASAPMIPTPAMKAMTMIATQPAVDGLVRRGLGSVGGGLQGGRTPGGFGGRWAA